MILMNVFGWFLLGVLILTGVVSNPLVIVLPLCLFNMALLVAYDKHPSVSKKPLRKPYRR